MKSRTIDALLTVAGLSALLSASPIVMLAGLALMFAGLSGPVNIARCVIHDRVVDAIYAVRMRAYRRRYALSA
jgi:hypothetical protein